MNYISNKKVLFLAIFMVGIMLVPISAFAINDYFTQTYRNFIRSFGFTDSVLEAECQADGTNQIMIFDIGGLMAIQDICSNNYNDAPFNFEMSNYFVSKGQVSQQGFIYQILDNPTGNPSFLCSDCGDVVTTPGGCYGADPGLDSFLACIAEPTASTSIVFSETYPDPYGEGHAFANFSSTIIDVSWIIGQALLALVVILAGLLGLGFAIRHVKRWITGRKA